MTNAAELCTVRADDGVELPYEVKGEGRPVALLHGALASRTALSAQRDALAPARRTILPSMRGHDGGEMRLPADYGVDTSDVRDLAAVLEAEGIERLDLVAHSSGGATAFAFARAYPERVGRMVLIEPTLLRVLAPADRAGIVTAFEEVIAVAAVQGEAAALRVALDSIGGRAWHALDEARQQRVLQALAPLAPLAAPHCRALLALPVSEADLAALAPPTLLIYGADSLEVEPKIAACWHRVRPDLPLLTVDGAGHNVHRDAPEIVTKAIVDFLAEV